MTEQKGPEKPAYIITSAELDRYVDVVGGSYDQAKRHFGIISPDQIDSSDDPDYEAAVEAKQTTPNTVADSLAAFKGIEEGPSLSLKGRARALDTIMKQFNQDNKTQGAQASRDYNDIDRRYERPDEVLGNMRSKSSRMGREAIDALDILAEGDSGVPMPDDADFAGSIESDLRKKFGPGVAYAPERNKMLRRVYRSAGLKKPR